MRHKHGPLLAHDYYEVTMYLHFASYEAISIHTTRARHKKVLHMGDNLYTEK